MVFRLMHVRTGLQRQEFKVHWQPYYIWYVLNMYRITMINLV